MGDDAELLIPYDLDRALVFGQGVVESDFLLGQSFFLTPLAGVPDVLGELDELLDNLGCRDGIAVIADYGIFQAFGEDPRLDNVGTAVGANLAIEQLAQCLHGKVAFSHALNFGQELI